MINKYDILQLTGKGLDIFKHYIPFSFSIGKNFKNPLYEDTNASCSRKSGFYKLKDFGNDAYSGDCFFYVGRLKGLDCNNSKDFIEILNIIIREMSLPLADTIQTAATPAKAKPVAAQRMVKELPTAPPGRAYSVIEKGFSMQELSFWTLSHITADILKRYNVLSIRSFTLSPKHASGKEFTKESSVDEPIFGYKGNDFVKTYMPLSKNRFLYLGNVPESYAFGLEQLPAKGNILFITGGEKDVMTLAANGFNAICFGSETVNIAKDLIKRLHYRFKHIVILYVLRPDGLEASLKHQQLLHEFEVKRLVLPLAGEKKEKDITDFFILGRTKEHLNQLLIGLLDNLYCETMSVLKACEIDF